MRFTSFHVFFPDLNRDHTRSKSTSYTSLNKDEVKELNTSNQLGEYLSPQEYDSFLQLRIKLNADSLPCPRSGYVVLEVIDNATDQKYTEIYQGISLHQADYDAWEEVVFPIPRNHRVHVVHNYGDVIIDKLVFLQIEA